MKLFINVYFNFDTLYFIVPSIQRHKQNLNDRDKAVTDLAKEFDVKGSKIVHSFSSGLYGMPK